MSNHILDSEEKVKKKIEMLEALAEIKVATTLLSESKDVGNKIDSNYAKLNRKIEPVDRVTNEFKVI
jgi:poly [ADP-ribose] polymerase